MTEAPLSDPTPLSGVAEPTSGATTQSAGGTTAGAGVAGTGATGGQTTAPSVGALSLPSTISANQIISLSVTVPESGDVTQITVSQALTGSAARKSARRVAKGKMIARVYRKTPKAKRYTIRLTEKQLRNLKPGRYVVEVRVGKSRTSLGPAKVRTITVKKAKAKAKAKAQRSIHASKV